MKNDSRINLHFPYCFRNLICVAPIDTFGETSSVQEGDAERVSVLRVLLVTIKPNLGSYNPCVDKKKPTNGYVFREREFVIEECFRGRLRKKSHTGWKENNGTLHKKWMKKYVFIDQHEIFFGEFPEILTKWLERLVEKTGRFSVATPKNWTLELVRKINLVSNPTTRVIDFWLDSILGGHVKKNFHRLYSVIQCCKNKFFQRLRWEVLEVIEYVDKDATM
jgi:hypothetical protein